MPPVLIWIRLPCIVFVSITMYWLEQKCDEEREMIKWMPMLFLVLSAIFSAAINRDISAAIYLSAAGICFYLGRTK